MTDPVKEQLSAFLDGELGEGEAPLLLRRLGKEQHGDTAGRYLLIGEAMRMATSKQPAAGPSRNFADRVRAALEQEQGQQGNVARRMTPRASTAHWLKVGGGLAIAASVGAAAVLLVQIQPIEKQAPVTAGTITSAPTLAPVAAPVEVPAATLAAAEKPRASKRQGDMGIREVSATSPERRLTNYMVAHSEYSMPLGRRNVLTGILAEDEDLQDGQSGAAQVSWSTR